MQVAAKKRKAQDLEVSQTPKKLRLELMATGSRATEQIAPDNLNLKAAPQSRSRSNGVTQSLRLTGQAPSSNENAIIPKHQKSNERNPGKDESNKPDKSVSGPSKPGKNIRKLAPQRPFPNVPTSASATGPRSAHKDGKNMICVTRKTPLGAYLRRCKSVVMEDGYRVLHLHALGAAIPHLVRLGMSLPDILPFSKDEIHTEVTTGTLKVFDEVLPDDDDEDISLQSRSKSTLIIVMTFGDGSDERKQVIAKRKQKSTVRQPHVDDDSRSEIGEIVMQEISDEE